MKVLIDEFISYPDTPDEFNTIDKVIKNLPKQLPSVKVTKVKTPSGIGLGLSSNDKNKNDLKKAWIWLTYENGKNKYDELVDNLKLEDALESTGFYDFEE